ncbi:hypothetical protein QJS04_geneDACA010915 [Acorus gramineus]|uniref:Prolactin receptor n=1 Tax=Acorus gramineus TaxID=55184 RepID=A0AAV9BK72_ACOGR|nr:hypothetical protein QJS04_geneDACA010915 [Acorus gramineus]
MSPNIPGFPQLENGALNPQQPSTKSREDKPALTYALETVCKNPLPQSLSDYHELTEPLFEEHKISTPKPPRVLLS